MTNAKRRSRPRRPCLKFPLRDFFFVVASFSFLELLISCAAQQPPPGGPIDSVKPKIDSTWPRNRQLNVSRNPKIYLEFNQDIDEGSFNQAFSITPYLNGTPKFHWSGFNRVRIDLPDTLRDSTTYTVQITRDLKTHAAAGGSPRGGQLPTPFFLTFSTGPNIDTGSLSGYLLVPLYSPPMKPSSLFVFAYDISVQNPDTLNFSTTPPDQLTQPNDQGLWQFLAMKVGHRYRVFTLADVYRNKVYDAGVDAFGVPAGDAILDSATKKGMYIRMAPPIDTTKPEMTDVDVVDSFHIRAHFSEAIDSESVRAGNFKLTASNSPSSVGGGGWGVVSAFRNDKKPGQITLLVTQPQQVRQDYTLEAVRDSIRDLARNPLNDTAYKVTFTSPDELRHVDTVTFVTINLRDSTRDISQLPQFPLIFSDAVNRDSAEQAVKLIDSLHHAVPIRFQWHDDAKAWFQPVDSLLSNAFYTIEIYTSKVQSPVAAIPHRAKDTVFRFHFRTANSRDFGKIQGTISIADSFFTAPKSALVVQVMQGDALVAQKILPRGAKDFEFDQIPVASYRIRAYLSKDGTGTYDPGSVRPWRFAAPTGEYPKPVDTRPRWTIANIDFDVK